MTIRTVEIGDTVFMVIGRYWIPVDDMDIDTACGPNSDQVCIRRRSTNKKLTFTTDVSKAIIRFLDRVHIGVDGLSDDE